MGTLYAKVGGTWEAVSQEEVFVSGTDPGAGEIWVDTSVDPPTLKANVGGLWTPIVSGSETEVSIGNVDPYIADPTAVEGSIELWHDTTLDPGTMKARVAGLWQPIAGSDEMSVGAIDPISVNPRIELWYDTDKTDSAPTLGTLKVNVGGTWHTATSEEVFVDDQDPLTRGNTEAELWYDTTTAELKVQHPLGSWTVVSSDSSLAPDEVTVSPAPPRDIQTEMWVDTSTDPAVFKYKDPATGAWMTITADGNVPAPLDEVWVGQVDPRDSSTELWYDTDAVPSTYSVTNGIIESMMIEMSQMRSDLADARSRISILEAHARSTVV